MTNTHTQSPWDWQTTWQHILTREAKLQSASESVLKQLKSTFTPQRWGDLMQWHKAYTNLPNVPAQATVDDTIRIDGDLTATQTASLHTSLNQLMPWRKGPFQLFDAFIDTEWRSDWKWQRLLPHLPSLTDQTVLDVGCGSGYHTLRMAGAQAKLALGIELMPQYFYQFQTLQHYAQLPNAAVLPLTLEQLPDTPQVFDLVFSMGVLYHRRSPFEHLADIKRRLKPGGTLVLETLIVDGDAHTCLTPVDRYAKMRNVWFLPSIDMTLIWLQKLKFKQARCVDVTVTSTAEQRTTPWMTQKSLADFLDPVDEQKTVEGYPRPKRAIFMATL